MTWITAKSVTDHRQSSKVTTKIRTGLRPLENILIRRIPVNLLVSQVGHFWIELLHKDETEIDELMKNTFKKGLKEKDINDENGNPLQHSTKANNFRESYGWYPVQMKIQLLNIFIDKRIVSSDGILNGDHAQRRKEDEEETLTELTHTKDRKAGRKSNNNEYSSRAFDPHQSNRFHPEKIKFTSHPYVLPSDTRSDEEIFNEIRAFAQAFEDEWSWGYDCYKETNCHTFLFLLLATCNLADPDCIGEELDRHFKRYKKSLDKHCKGVKETTIKRRILMEKLLDISENAKPK
ncbi:MULTISPECIES: hypothetical protein [unclassified Gilliamella]|uniref:hypothetical protein n=1 Tax=unclassified Gilliamella TaxID=2685620 RepID=UPI00080DF9B2|nr:hypothetical protein [Gilliamella apicola]OCG18570.1 hypothetical protein A9G23_10720 [Gilliamella apicola]OCG24397.1 hypothetical protein A9G22_04590 [Gilliamella apicola]